MNDRRDSLLQGSKTDSFLETVYACSRAERDERENLALDIAALHNDGLIDVVAAFECLGAKSSKGVDFFLTRHIFEKALPRISAPIQSVMRCVLQLYRDAGQDMAAGGVLESYVGFCEKDPARPRDALKDIEANPGMFADLLTATISAGSRIDNPRYLAEAIRLCEDSNIELKRRAVHAVGRLNWPEGSMVPESAFAALEQSVATNSDDQILAGVVKSTFALWQRDKTHEVRTVALIDSALSKGGEYAFHAASELFGFHSRELPALLVDVLLSHLTHVNPSNKGTIDNVDLGIANLIETSEPGQAIRFLEDLLIAHPGKLTLKTFDGAAHEIRSRNALLSKLVTRWLLRGEQALCAGINVIVSARYGDHLCLDIDPTELKPADAARMLFVARKAIGYLLFQPVSVASLLISLMRNTADDDILRELGELLFNPVLMNYTGKTREYVVQQSGLESGKVKETIDAALKAIHDYLDVLQSVGTLPALFPGEAQREAYHRNLARSMAESFKAAEAQSVLLNLISKSILLYGRKSIDYVHGGGGPPHRMETDLKNHGTEIEFPRMENIDSFGLDYMLRVYRMERFRA